MVRRAGSRAAFSLAAFAVSFAVTSCADYGYNPKRDPALNVGKLKIGMRERRLERLLGAGIPAQWVDERGQHVSVLLYRNGSAILAAVIDTQLVTGLEFFQKMTGADVHNEFSLAQASQPFATHVPIAQMTWLGRPVFSDALPATPSGWRVPTDFTVSQGGKSFYVTRGDRVVSKEHSKGYGWVVHLQ